MGLMERRTRVGLGREAAERVSAGLYGAIVAASTLAGTEFVPPGRLILLVVATNLVYYATHVFAYTIGDPDIEHRHLAAVVKHHAKISAPMISAAFLPLVVVLVLDAVGVAHENSTRFGILTAAAYLVSVAVPGAYLHGVRGGWLVLLTIGILVATSLLVSAKVFLTH